MKKSRISSYFTASPYGGSVRLLTVRVNLDSLCAPGGEAELDSGLQARRLRKSAPQHLTVANVHGPVIQYTRTRFTAIERIADVVRGSDQEFDSALAILVGEAVAQHELVGPGDDVAGLIVPGRVHDEKVHAEGFGSEVLVRELRAGFGHGAVIGVVNARRGPGPLLPHP
jgi:hypothetical protein